VRRRKISMSERSKPTSTVEPRSVEDRVEAVQEAAKQPSGKLSLAEMRKLKRR
jgi:hypothetical protein